MTQNITSEFWDYVEQDKAKLARRVYNWLNYDLLNAIILNDNIFWYETNLAVNVPNYIHNYIKKWGVGRGYLFLWDLPIKH